MVTETESAELQFSHPARVKLGEQFPLTIEHLPAKDRVAVELSCVDFHDTEWTTQATYETGSGRIELHDQSPIDGPGDGDILTAIQSMEAAVERPFQPPPEGELDVVVKQNGAVLGSTSVTRTLGDPAVTAQDIDSAELSGTLFEPPGDEPAPGVVVLHGSGGGPDMLRGRTLASRGFVTAAIEYFDTEDLPDQLVSVPVETVDRATDYVLGCDRVQGAQVGLVGQSKGGELALLAASRNERVGAVVSISGSGVVWEGISEDENPFPGSTWTADGQPVEYVPYSTDQSLWEDVFGSFQDPDPPFELEQAYSQSFEEADETTIADATIPVEHIDGPVLLVSGGDDRMWDSERLQQIAVDRLADHDHPYEVDHLVYDDAGHGISVPYQPTANRTAGREFVYGGSQEGYATADRDHWSRVCAVLQSVVE